MSASKGAIRLFFGKGQQFTLLNFNRLGSKGLQTDVAGEAKKAVIKSGQDVVDLGKEAR